MTGRQPPAAPGRVAADEPPGPGQRVAGRGLLVAGILLIAINLRAPLTVIGPLLSTISRQYALSGTEAGVLNTLPLLAFAAFSPVVPRVSARLGLERSLLLAVLVLAAGTVLRSVPSAAALFAGTLALGVAIAVANTLLPVLVKRNFASRLSTVTGLYVATMGLGATLASGVAVPLAGAAPAGWHTAAGCWAALAVPAVALWLPQLRRSPSGEAPAAGAVRGAHAAMPWRSPLAWQVTVFMGLQSLGFYVMVGWLPTLLESHGTSAHAAGWLVALYQSINLLVSLSLPALIDRTTGQRAIAVGCALCSAAGYTGLLLAPGAAIGWVLVAGVGTGGCFVLALSFMALRAGEPRQTAALSAMAQSIGYLLAAGGPVLFGFLHDSTGSWTGSLLMLLATALVLATAGIGAGRPARVAPR